MNSGSARTYAINTYSYTLAYSAADCLNHLADQGFSEFELMMYPGHAWPAELDAGGRKELARLVAARGLRIHTLNMPNVDLNLAGAAPEMRRYTLDILCGVVELAGELGVPGVIVGPGKYNPLFPAPRERLMGWFFEALDRLVPLAEQAGTSILMENMSFAFLPDAEGLMAALEQYGEEKIGAVYDIANGHFIGEDIAAGLRRMGARLRLVHVSDTGPAVYRHDPVGRGTVPFREVGAHLGEIAPQAPIVLEIISHTADVDIQESIAALSALGWDALAVAPVAAVAAGTA